MTTSNHLSYHWFWCDCWHKAWGWKHQWNFDYVVLKILRKRNIVFHTHETSDRKKIGFHIGSRGSLRLDHGTRRICSNSHFICVFKNTFNLLCSQFGVSVSFQCDMARHAIYSELVNALEKKNNLNLLHFQIWKGVYSLHFEQTFIYLLNMYYVSRFSTNFRLFLLIFSVHCLLSAVCFPFPCIN